MAPHWITPWLINPNQVRAYGIHLWDNPYDATRNLGIEVDDDLFIALHTAGTKIHFRTGVPTTQELQDCPHVQMTSSSPWNPSNLTIMVQELNQGGTPIPWHRPTMGVASLFYPNAEYLEATSDDALLHSVDPSLVRVGELLSKRSQQVSEIDTTVYEQAPGHSGPSNLRKHRTTRQSVGGIVS